MPQMNPQTTAPASDQVTLNVQSVNGNPFVTFRVSGDEEAAEIARRLSQYAPLPKGQEYTFLRDGRPLTPNVSLSAQGIVGEATVVAIPFWVVAVKTDLPAQQQNGPQQAEPKLVGPEGPRRASRSAETNVNVAAVVRRSVFEDQAPALVDHSKSSMDVVVKLVDNLDNMLQEALDDGFKFTVATLNQKVARFVLTNGDYLDGCNPCVKEETAAPKQVVVAPVMPQSLHAWAQQTQAPTESELPQIPKEDAELQKFVWLRTETEGSDFESERLHCSDFPGSQYLCGPFPQDFRRTLAAVTDAGGDRSSGVGFVAHRAVFADKAGMKEKVREAVATKQYNVADYYKETGCAQWIATHPWFDNLTILVIALNAVWIAIDTDTNDADILVNAKLHFIIVENLFCLFFFFEWLVRFAAFKAKSDSLKDLSFVFDTILVFLMVMETWVMSLFFLLMSSTNGASFGNVSVLRVVKLIRLSRAFRMARLLRAIPEIMILVKAIKIATRSVFFSLCLLMMVIYVFAIAFVQLTQDTTTGTKYFDGILSASGNLLLVGNLPDHADFVKSVYEGDPVWGALLMIFVFFSALTLMGMLTGILVEVVNVVSHVERETMVVNFVTDQLLTHMRDFDADGNECISRVEFTKLLTSQSCARMLQSVGVDVVGLADFCELLFNDKDTISFRAFLELVLQLRGNNQATVKDIVDLRKFIRHEFADVLVQELTGLERRAVGKLQKTIKQQVAIAAFKSARGAAGAVTPVRTPRKVTEDNRIEQACTGASSEMTNRAMAQAKSAPTVANNENALQAALSSGEWNSSRSHTPFLNGVVSSASEDLTQGQAKERKPSARKPKRGRSCSRQPEGAAASLQPEGSTMR